MYIAREALGDIREPEAQGWCCCVSTRRAVTSVRAGGACGMWAAARQCASGARDTTNERSARANAGDECGMVEGWKKEPVRPCPAVASEPEPKSERPVSPSRSSLD